MKKIILSLFLSTTYLLLVAQPKHVVLIVADDLGARDLSVYDNDFIETPHVERFINNDRGVVVQNAYASSPICSPTRASIITGLAPARLGITEHYRGNPPVPPSQRLITPTNAPSVDKTLPTIAKIAKEQGYATAIIGKWHLGGGASGPSNYGYDYTFASGSPGLPNSFFYPFFGNNTFPELLQASSSGDYLTDVLGDEAVRYINENKDQPFFLHLNFYSPHVPIQAKPDLVTKYEEKRKANPNMQFPEPHYAAMVESIDENVGKVLAALRSIGKMDDMLVIFTSDHGGLSVQEVPGFDAHTPPTDNGELRGGKGYLYEGGVRVPFLINKEIDEATVTTSTDLFNTIAAYIGSPARTRDGIDILAENPEDRTLFWHYPHYSPQGGSPVSAVYKRGDKLVWHHDRDHVELYYGVATKTEQTNQVAEQTYTNVLMNELTNWIDTIGGKYPTFNPDFNPQGVLVEETFDYANETVMGQLDQGKGWYSDWYQGTLDGTSKVVNMDEDGYLELKVQNTQKIEVSREIDIPYNCHGDAEFWFAIDHRSTLGKGLTEINLVNKNHENFLVLAIDGNTNKAGFGVDQSLSALVDINHLEANRFVFMIKPSTSTIDSVFMWINIDESMMPDPSQATILAGDFESDFIDNLSIKVSGYNGQYFTTVDNIKMGPSFGSISTIFQQIGSNTYEPFDYQVDSPIEQNGRTEGGFVGSWINTGTASQKAILREGNLEYGGLETLGNHCEFDYTVANTQMRTDRLLANPILSLGDTYWVSFIMDVELGAARNNVVNLNLVNSTNTNKTGLIAAIGKLYGSEKIGIVFPQSNQQFSTDISASGSHWIVMKIVTMPDASDDEVYIWIDPLVGEEPLEANADIKAKTKDLQEGISHVRLRTEGAGANQVPVKARFDELRIGNKWGKLVNKTSDISSKATVYPNPSFGQLVISTTYEDLGEIMIEMYGLNGQILRRQDLGYIIGSDIILHTDDLDYSGYVIVRLYSPVYGMMDIRCIINVIDDE